MLDALLNYLFGCNHKKTTFPLTHKANFHNPAEGNRSMYIVCLNCGAEFAYDWKRMRVGLSLPTSGSLSGPLNWRALKAGAGSLRVTQEL